MKILIADDSSIIRESLGKLISRNNPEAVITNAVNVRDAINKICEQNPDLIVLDLTMPGGDGFDVLREVQKRERKTTVILLTNYATDVNRKRGEQAKADFFFDKTDEFYKVIDVIKQKKKRVVASKCFGIRNRDRFLERI